MKSESDHYTRDLLGDKLGRPRKASSKSGAQRQREYRKRKTQGISVTGDEKASCSWCGVERNKCCGICNVGQLGHL